jgi:hypothetical protein
VQFSLLQAAARLPRASKASDGSLGLSGGTILSWKQEQKLSSEATKSRHGGTKNVTSNLPLLSMLAFVIFN